MSDNERFKGGTSSGREKLNSMQDELGILSKIRGDSRFITVTKGIGGVNVSLNIASVIAAISHAANALSPVVITSIDGDTVTGRYLYPDDEGDLAAGTVDVVVLKPWTLRRTPFDGETVNGVTYTYSSDVEREADDGDITETQYVTQDYFVGAVIYVKPVNEPGYDVIDDNVDARAWAK